MKAKEFLENKGYDETHWGKRIIAAETQGEYTQDDVDESGDWMSCACGKLDTYIEIGRSGTSAPMDDNLYDLGCNFSDAVMNDDFDINFLHAAELLVAIEERSIELSEGVK